MRRTLSTLSPRLLTFGGALWAAKGFGAMFAPSPLLEPIYAVGFVGGIILFFIALGFAVAGRADAGRAIWIVALLTTLLVTVVLISVGGAMRSAGSAWYGVEVPIVVSGLLWSVLGLAGSGVIRSKSRGEVADIPFTRQ